jgi:DNA polymerase-3 subunit delta'
MQFNDVIGQQETKQHLIDMVANNRLSHALLFLGKEGSGALPLALAFANYISIKNGIAGKKKQEAAVSLFGDPEFAETEPTHFTPATIDAWMQKQEGFSKANTYTHPDIHFSYPVIPRKSGDKPVSTDYITEWREFIQKYPYGNSYDWLQFIGAENKQGNITAYECNEIIRKLNLKSFESEYKVLVLWMPEYLGNEGNKLLKLIEEPPANTLFILVAENESLILQTILSRTQLVKIPMLEPTDIEKSLTEKSKIAPAQAQQIAGISEGNYREALQMLQHSDEDWNDLLREWLNALLKNGPAAQVKWIEEVSKQGREKQKQFLRYFTHLLEQSIRLKFMGNAISSFSLAQNEKDFAERFNKLTDVAQQQAIVEELDKAAYYIERNANAKMLFHALSIKLYHIIKDKVAMQVN